MMLPFLFKKSRLYCEQLRKSDSNLKQIQNFYIEREKEINCKSDLNTVIGLEQYLKRRAWLDDRNNLNKIYLVKDRKTKQIAGYFALKAGMVSIGKSRLKKQEQEELSKLGILPVSASVPGIELSQFAVNDKFRQEINKEVGKKVIGLGKYFFSNFIFPIIVDVSKKIGVRFFYLYAADGSSDGKLIAYYKEVMGLRQLDNNEIMKENMIKPIRSDYDSGCIFMYRTLDN